MIAFCYCLQQFIKFINNKIYIQQSLRMKKFLHLKRSIVDSKNQPTIMQTYLDTIRSSCYKLATPNISPKMNKNTHQGYRKMQQLSGKANQNVSEHEQKMKRAAMNNQVLRFLSQKQSQQKQGSNQQFESKCIWRKSPNKVLQIFSPKASRNNAQLQISETHPQIQQIFQTLSSHCKSSRKQSYKSQKQIIETIMVSLEQLNKKKQFQQSVQLIKNIIMSLQLDRDSRNAKFEAIANHSQVKDMDYIVQKHENDIGINSVQNSHFKSYMQLEDDRVKNQLSQNNDKKVATKINWQKPQNLNQSNQQNNQKFNQDSNQASEPFRIKYTVYKNNKKAHEGQSIYIQDPESEQAFTYPQAENTPRQLYQQNTERDISSNSMESQDINQWKKQQLYCIEEQEQEDYKSSSLSSIVPQETIQFKKILYMLDSESTTKKPQNKQGKKNGIKNNQPNMRLKTRSTSNHSVRSLFSQGISIEEQSMIKGERFRTEASNQSSPKTLQNIENDQNSSIMDKSKEISIQSSEKKSKKLPFQSSMVKNKQKDVNKSIKSMKLNQVTMPLKSKDIIKNNLPANQPVNAVKVDKSKQLKQIVSMLSNKYNRTIKLGKN